MLIKKLLKEYPWISNEYLLWYKKHRIRIYLDGNQEEFNKIFILLNQLKKIDSFNILLKLYSQNSNQ